MKTIKTNNNDLILIELTKDVFYYDWIKVEEGICFYTEDINDRIHKYLLPKEIQNINQINILGKLSELTDEELENFCYYFEDEDIWMNYNKTPPYIPYRDTAKQSFISLLQSEGMDTSKEILLIEIL